MNFGYIIDSIDESITRKLSQEEEIALLERKKRSLLHELSVLSDQMHNWIETGVITQMGEGDKHPNAPKIPDAETRRILTNDTVLQQRVLKTFARFSTAKEILSNSVMPELEELQKTKDTTLSPPTKDKK